MLRRWLIAAVVALISIPTQSTLTVHAQGPTTEDVKRLSVLVDIRESVIRSIGAAPETVDVSMTDKALTVARINSKLNRSSHAGRDNEAKAIARIVSEWTSGKSEFRGLVAIRVQYEMRSTLFRKTHILVVDTVAFRAGPDGRFQFGQT